MKNKVSIIVPVYNCEAYLADCLDSIERQTYKNIEVVLINDGSTDNGIDILNKYAKKNKNWKVITQVNQGLSMARNNGVDISTGDYIFFLDSDDVIPDDAIEKLVNKIESSDCDMVIGNMINYNSKGKYSNYTSKYIRNADNINYNKFPQLLSFIHAAGKLYKRKLIIDVRFISNVKHEDNYFNLSMYLKKIKISMITDDVYYHRIREGNDKSITQNLNYQTFKDLLINYGKVVDENTLDSKFNIILSKKMINYIYKRINKKEIKVANADMKNLMKKMDEKTNVSALRKFLIKVYRKMYTLFVMIIMLIKR